MQKVSKWPVGEPETGLNAIIIHINIISTNNSATTYMWRQYCSIFFLSGGGLNCRQNVLHCKTKSKNWLFVLSEKLLIACASSHIHSFIAYLLYAANGYNVSRLPLVTHTTNANEQHPSICPTTILERKVYIFKGETAISALVASCLLWQIYTCP